MMRVPVSPAFRETFRKVGAGRVQELVPGIADLVRQGRNDAEIVEWLSQEGLGRGFGAWLASKVRDHGEDLTFDLEAEVAVVGRTYENLPRIHLDLVVGGLFFVGLLGHVLYNVAEDQKYLVSHPEAKNLPSFYMLLGLLVGVAALVQLARRETLGFWLAIGVCIPMGGQSLYTDNVGAAFLYGAMTLFCLGRLLGYPRDKNADPIYWRTRERNIILVGTIATVCFGGAVTRGCAREIAKAIPVRETDKRPPEPPPTPFEP